MRRQHHGGVAGMHTGELNVFQHAADDDRLSVRQADVRDAIHIHLRGVLEKFVHQHRAFRRGLHREPHVMRQFRVRINDLHRAAAQHETRAHQHRIPQALGGDERLGLVRGQAVRRLRDVQPGQHGREQLAVLGDLDALRRGADDVHAVLLQAQREIQRRLPAELRDRAPALFAFVDVQHVLERERLKKQLVARVVIRGNRLRVRVHHDSLETVLLERKSRVHAAVIELDALADAVGSAAENHHLLGRVALHLVIAAVVRGIIIRRVGLELRGAGVHQPVAGDDAEFFSFGAHGILGRAGEMGDLPVGKPERLGLGQHFRIERH